MGIFLSGAVLVSCDLSSADISQGAFVLTMLTDANMDCIIAWATDFPGADLTGANLHAAKPNGTVLGVVYIRGAEGDTSGRSVPTNLIRADLNEFDLTGVDLGEAVLNDTNVAGAIMDRH